MTTSKLGTVYLDWTPYYRKDIDSLEAVQRRMTKMIQGLRGLPYEDMIKRLNLHSLEIRMRGNMMEVFKWVKRINEGGISNVLKVNNWGRTRI